MTADRLLGLDDDLGGLPWAVEVQGWHLIASQEAAEEGFPCMPPPRDDGRTSHPPDPPWHYRIALQDDVRGWFDANTKRSWGFRVWADYSETGFVSDPSVEFRFASRDDAALFRVSFC